MRRIHLNLKRFDILPKYGGVNTLVAPNQWGAFIIEQVQAELSEIARTQEVEFTLYFPESHLIGALNALKPSVNLSIGCQSVYREDTAKGGNFGAFTTQRTAQAMRQLGVTATIIGHLEERLDKNGILTNAGLTNLASVNQLLNQEIKMAQKAGLKVLYCVGEQAEERANWQQTLQEQVTMGLAEVDQAQVVIAYEPVWAIGPGKTPPTTMQIAEVVDYIHALVPAADVIYGGGLKDDNAADLAGITDLAGGLIALTRFSGAIGFYPDEYLQIIRKFLGIAA